MLKVRHTSFTQSNDNVNLYASATADTYRDVNRLGALGFCGFDLELLRTCWALRLKTLMCG